MRKAGDQVRPEIGRSGQRSGFKEQGRAAGNRNHGHGTQLEKARRHDQGDPNSRSGFRLGPFADSVGADGPRPAWLVPRRGAPAGGMTGGLLWYAFRPDWRILYAGMEPDDARQTGRSSPRRRFPLNPPPMEPAFGFRPAARQGPPGHRRQRQSEERADGL